MLEAAACWRGAEAGSKLGPRSPVFGSLQQRLALFAKREEMTEACAACLECLPERLLD